MGVRKSLAWFLVIAFAATACGTSTNGSDGQAGGGGDDGTGGRAVNAGECHGEKKCPSLGCTFSEYKKHCDEGYADNWENYDVQFSKAPCDGLDVVTEDEGPDIGYGVPREVDFYFDHASGELVASVFTDFESMSRTVVKSKTCDGDESFVIPDNCIADFRNFEYCPMPKDGC